MSEPYAPIEVTCKTIQGRFLLMPSDRLNELIAGIIGQAQQKHASILVHLFVAMSNHMHWILAAPDCQTLSDFMRDVNGLIAKEAGRLYDWPDKLWSQRYQSVR